MSGIEKLQLEHAQIFYIFGIYTLYFIILLTLSKSHKFSTKGEDVHVDSPPTPLPFMNKVLMRELMIGWE